MKNTNSLLVVRQLDRKLEALRLILTSASPFPTQGWINLLRQTLNMSLRQLGQRLKVTPQGIKDIENREREGAITINALKEVGDAMGLQFVYAFIPKKDSLEEMIERKAREIAQKIVNRTSTSMKLEDQENSPKRIQQAIEELTIQIKREIPKSLWD